MIKACFLVLSLMAGGNSTMINFDEVLTIVESPITVFGTDGTKVYFVQGGTLGQSSIIVKESVDEIFAKVEQCNQPFPPYQQFILVK